MRGRGPRPQGSTGPAPGSGRARPVATGRRRRQRAGRSFASLPPCPSTPQLDADPQHGPERFERARGEWPHPHDHSAQLHRAILHDLRSAGPSSPDEVGRRVGTSRTSALQQLRALEAAGLARHATRQARRGPAAPRATTSRRSPRASSRPTTTASRPDMLAAIEAVGGQELLGEVFRARRDAVAKRVRDRLADRLPAGATLVDRVRELAVIQDEAGYLCSATVDDDGTSVRLAENNCAIFRVATSHPRRLRRRAPDCSADVLGADVVRESHIMVGDRCCSYRISETRRGLKPCWPGPGRSARRDVRLPRARRRRDGPARGPAAGRPRHCARTTPRAPSRPPAAGPRATGSRAGRASRARRGCRS